MSRYKKIITSDKQVAKRILTVQHLRISVNYFRINKID